MEIATEIEKRRKALGWSAEDLAYHARVSAQQIRNIETGKTKQPRAATLFCLEQALLRAEGRYRRRGKL